jgi:hypothetical protein
LKWSCENAQTWFRKFTSSIARSSWRHSETEFPRLKACERSWMESRNQKLSIRKTPLFLHEMTVTQEF